MPPELLKQKYPNVFDILPHLKRKVGRNSLCECGSGRKQKHCCQSCLPVVVSSKSEILKVPGYEHLFGK